MIALYGVVVGIYLAFSLVGFTLEVSSKEHRNGQFTFHLAVSIVAFMTFVSLILGGN